MKTRSCQAMATMDNTEVFFRKLQSVGDGKKPTWEQAHQSITATEPMFSEFLIEIVVDVEKMHKFRVPF